MCSLITCVSKHKIIRYKYRKDQKRIYHPHATEKGKDLDKIAGLIEKEGGVITGKHKKGDVVTANIPVNKIEEIARDYSVKSILPNRVIVLFYRIASHK